jgi:hypothetical protein
MSNYTIHVSKDQKDLIVAALEKVAQMTMGQTFKDQQYARKLLGQFAKDRNSSTIDLSKVVLE